MADGPAPGHVLLAECATLGNPRSRPGGLRPLGLLLREGRDPPPGPRVPGVLPALQGRGEAGLPEVQGARLVGLIEWTEHGNGCRWDSVPHPRVTRVYLKGVGHVRVHQHRAVKGAAKTITVKREGDRWYVVLSCDDVPAEPLEPTGAAVGIDLGVASFLTTSDGKHVPNPRHRSPQPPTASLSPSGPSPARNAAVTGEARQSARSRACIARCAAPGWTTHTRPRWPWSVTTT